MKHLVLHTAFITLLTSSAYAITIEEAKELFGGREAGEIIKSESGVENGVKVYDLDILSPEGELLQIRINAETGEVMGFEDGVVITGDNVRRQEQGFMSHGEAQEIAKQYVMDLGEDDDAPRVVSSRLLKDKDKNDFRYRIKIKQSHDRYEMIINAETGEITRID